MLSDSIQLRTQPTVTNVSSMLSTAAFDADEYLAHDDKQNISELGHPKASFFVEHVF